jgi:tRNA (cytidine56-2'-O)-methyltransferase
MIRILRLGHRIGRDDRMTTHVFLTARALGASSGVFCGDQDSGPVESVSKICENWGGKFPVTYSHDWKGEALTWKKKGGKIVHLTMYGERVQDVVKRIPKKAGLLVVVGAEKVPSGVYSLADFNVAVTNQPHSEVAALAVFLDKYLGGRELEKRFRGKISISPSERGKCVFSCKKKAKI